MEHPNLFNKCVYLLIIQIQCENEKMFVMSVFIIFFRNNYVLSLC